MSTKLAYIVTIYTSSTQCVHAYLYGFGTCFKFTFLCEFRELAKDAIAWKAFGDHTYCHCCHKLSRCCGLSMGIADLYVQGRPY